MFKNKNNLITFALLTAGSFHLSFFGLLPFGYKIIGDLLLFGILVYCIINRLITPLNDKLSKITYFMSLSFLIYSLLLVAYTFLLWGDITNVITWSRRWLISSIYLMMVSSNLMKNINSKMFTVGIIMGSIITGITIILERNFGLDFSGVTTSYEIQGGLPIIKVFNNGNLLIMISSFLFISLFFYKFSVKHLILLFISIVCFFYLINFRSWWASIPIAFFITILIVFRSKNNLYSKFKVISFIYMVSFLFLSGILVMLLMNYDLSLPSSDRISWITSGITELKSGEGNMGSRYEVDGGKLSYIWSLNDVYLRVFGIGFVGDNNNGYLKLGFTSETNDSGWVEILLTGGLLGLLIVVLQWLSHFFRLLMIARVKSNPLINAALIFWIISFLLMISANFLLWDYGFVVFFWIYSAALSYSYNSTDMFVGDNL